MSLNMSVKSKVALLNDQFELSTAIKDDVRESVKHAKLAVDGIQDIKSRSLSEQSREIISWLCPLNFWVKQRDVYAARLEGTSEWLFKDTKFQK
jgi:hypothetical protein